MQCGADGRASLGDLECQELTIGLQPRLLPVHNRTAPPSLTITGAAFWVPRVQAITVGGVVVEEWQLGPENSSLIFLPPIADEAWAESYLVVELNVTTAATPASPAGSLLLSCPDPSGDQLRGHCASLQDRLYCTEQCLQEGWYGTGTSCQPCPAGASCPGGSRVQPGPGFWREPLNESSPVVVPCQPTDYGEERCLGGWASACGAVYSEENCGSCTNGLAYSSGNGCRYCSDDEYGSQRLLQGLVIVGTYTCLGLAITFTPSEVLLNTVVFYVVLVQQLVVVVGSVIKGNDLDWMLWVKAVYDVAKLVDMLTFTITIMIMIMIMITTTTTITTRPRSRPQPQPPPSS